MHRRFVCVTMGKYFISWGKLFRKTISTEFQGIRDWKLEQMPDCTEKKDRTLVDGAKHFVDVRKVIEQLAYRTFADAEQMTVRSIYVWLLNASIYQVRAHGV